MQFMKNYGINASIRESEMYFHCGLWILVLCDKIVYMYYIFSCVTNIDKNTYMFYTIHSCLDFLKF